ncbi:hypothetical protein L0F63_002725, partial [Massospora cicadina]
MGEPLIEAEFNQLKFKFSPSVGKGLNLLILLHGLGDNEDNFFKLGKRLNLPQTAVVALQAPLRLPLFEGSYMWWNSFDLLTGDEIKPTYSERSVRGCMEKLKGFLNYAISKGWRSEGLFLLGFSQGASAALEAALSSPAKLGGVGLKITHELPVLITLGDRDPSLPVASAFSAVDKMRGLFSERNRKAIECKIISNKGHEMSHRPDEVRTWMEFFGRHLLLSNPELEGRADVVEVNLG